MRELLFSAITRAEAALKAVCAHEFTRLHPDEVNPYLNPDYYDSRRRPSAVVLIDKVFKRILELDGNPRNRGDYGGKAYIRHCMEDHNGQVPLWVLANDLSFGQTVWFFQVQSPAVRLAVAESFTGLYADTHDGPRRITIKRLDSIFNRLVFYRNLCAHDERCYCARYDGRANENVYQAIGDLGYLLDKDDYLELFGRFSALVARATFAMPFWAVCNRPVGFGMDLGCHWRLGRLYGPRIVLSIVRHGDVLPGECFCTTHAEHHETTGGIALFRAGRRRR